MKILKVWIISSIYITYCVIVQTTGCNGVHENWSPILWSSCAFCCFVFGLFTLIMFTDQMVAIMNDRTGIEKLGKVGARRGCSAAHFSCWYTGRRQAGPDAVREFAARVWRGPAVAPHPTRAEPQTHRAPRISDVVVAF